MHQQKSHSNHQTLSQYHEDIQTSLSGIPPFSSAILLNDMASVYPIQSCSTHQVVLAPWDLHVRPRPSYASWILTSTASARIHLRNMAWPASPTNCKGLQVMWLPPRMQRPPACTTEPLWVQTSDIHPIEVLPTLFPTKRGQTAISSRNPVCVGNPLA